MDSNDNKLKNLNHIKERLEVISALELLIVKSNIGVSLNPDIKDALNKVYKYRYEVSDRIKDDVENELVNAICTKISMIKESLLPYIKVL